MDNKQNAIIKTLIYSSIFTFPLTSDELYRYCISPTPIDALLFKKTLRSLSSKLVLKDGYYALKGQENIIEMRKNMNNEVVHKNTIAHKISSLLSVIPTIYFIGVSGSLAAGSAQKTDDIDLFIITKKNTIFISRLCALLLLQVLGKRRKAGDVDAPDKICVNMWRDMGSLSFSPQGCDLYIAREVAQLKPFFTRGKTYQIFLEQNQWVEQFLPHALKEPFISPLCGRHYPFLEWLIARGEILAKALQLFFINRHRTTEEITPHSLSFHPINYRKNTLSAYKKQLVKEVKLL